MKIAVLSDTRQPTKPSGGHGLGRVAWDLATGLAQKGHQVSLFAGPDSDWGAPLFPTLKNSDETIRAEHMVHFHSISDPDVYVDLSHYHDLSRLAPDWPVVNYVMDLECAWQPPRAVVVNEWGRRQHPNARIVPLGVDVDAIPFVETPMPPLKHLRLIFCHKLHHGKGVDIAEQIALRVDMPVVFMGQVFPGNPVPETHVGEALSDGVLFDWLGNSLGLLSPTREDSGGRVNLESAACGTPVLTFDWTGTQYHVAHGVSGFICATVDEMVDAVADLPLLDRRKARAWVADTHSLKGMIDGIEALAVAARDGAFW